MFRGKAKSNTDGYLSILDFEYVFVNVELEVGLNNPFVSEYPIARLATEYPNVEGGHGGNIRAGAVSMGISHCEFN